MPGHTCVVCGSTPTKDPEASFHRLQSDPVRRGSWLAAFGLEESQLKAQSRVCYRHFRDRNAKNKPIASLGKRFASPVKRQNSRAKRAKTRESMREYSDLRMIFENESSSSSVTPCTTCPVSTLSAPLSENGERVVDEVLVNRALLSRIEVLEAENKELKGRLNQPSYLGLRIYRAMTILSPFTQALVRMRF